MEPVYRSVIGIARVVFAFEGLRFQVEGEENIPATGGAVIAVNHTGYLDFTYAGLPPRSVKRYIRFMAKKEVFDDKISGPIMRALKHIPVDRGAGAESYKAAVSSLRGGELVGVYPEATISRSFEIKEFKSGAARMAIEAGVPIIPTVIWGAQRVWTKGFPKRLGRTKTPHCRRRAHRTDRTAQRAHREIAQDDAGNAAETAGGLRARAGCLLGACQARRQRAYPRRGRQARRRRCGRAGRCPAGARERLRLSWSRRARPTLRPARRFR